MELDGIDVLANLNEPFELLPDNCADYVYSRHVLEHISEFIPLMGEIHRITKPDGCIELVVPHFSNPYYYSDPTHIRFFGLYSINYFVDPDKQIGLRKVPAFYSNIRFNVDSISIDFYQSSLLDRLIAPLFSKLVNLNATTQDFYERRLCHFFHAWQIRYKITPEK